MVRVRGIDEASSSALLSLVVLVAALRNVVALFVGGGVARVAEVKDDTRLLVDHKATKYKTRQIFMVQSEVMISCDLLLN
jgi:hypothetical protein